MSTKPMTKKQIRNELAKHFRREKRAGYAPPINVGGRRQWSWAPILRALTASAMLATLGCATTPAAAEPKCKRYCTNSKACGDGCIPYEHQCHKPPGSACTVSVHD